MYRSHFLSSAVNRYLDCLRVWLLWITLCLLNTEIRPCDLQSAVPPDPWEPTPSRLCFAPSSLAWYVREPLGLCPWSISSDRLVLSVVLKCSRLPPLAPPGYRAYLASKRCAQIACSLRKWKEKARIHQISSSGARLEQSPAHTAARYNLLRLTGTTQLLELRARELQKSEDTGTHASCYKSKVLGDTRVSAGEWSEKDLNWEHP